MLSYRTRHGSSPSGKPRIFFTAHPEEQRALLEDVSRDVLAIINAAIWYDDEPERDVSEDGEFFDSLGDMTLIIIAVTPRLLREPGRALGSELAFAKDNHIPILPIVCERIDDALYTKRLGELQYLERCSKDQTAIAYVEKLTRHLSSTLTDDTLADKVRAAFDAYIFLSYRKKDRKYAKELMQLIHSDEFCRDVAIWYDEYLTPGENFNDAIVEAFEKSQLFVMAVTPSVVNEVNYILTTEYPMAHSSSKPIIPVEMEKTDRAELERSYEGLPPCISKDEPTRLSDELKRQLGDSLRSLAMTEDRSSPEHSFFIGLAYFSGIDVEVDVKRGIELIRKAALADMPEAIEKLVHIYKNGEGVKKDVDEAVRWWQKLHLAYYKSRDRMEENAWIDKANESSDELAEFLVAEGRYHDAESVYNNNLSGSYGTRRISILWKMSKFYTKLGDDKNAIKRAERAEYEAKRYVYSDPDFYFSIALGLAEKYMAFGRMSEAEELIKKLLSEYGEYTSENTIKIHNLAVSHEELARIAILRGDAVEAQDHVTAATELRDIIYPECEEYYSTVGYFDLKSLHGYVLSVLGKQEEALTVISDARARAEKICELDRLPELEKMLGSYSALEIETMIKADELSRAADALSANTSSLHETYPKAKRLSLVASLAEKAGLDIAALALYRNARAETEAAPKNYSDNLFLAELALDTARLQTEKGEVAEAEKLTGYITERAALISDGEVAVISRRIASLGEPRKVSEPSYDKGILPFIFRELFIRREYGAAGDVLNVIKEHNDRLTASRCSAYLHFKTGELERATEEAELVAELTENPRESAKLLLASSCAHKTLGKKDRAYECAKRAEEKAKSLYKSNPCNDFLNLYYVCAVTHATRASQLEDRIGAEAVLRELLPLLSEDDGGERRNIIQHKRRRVVYLLSTVAEAKEGYLSEADRIGEQLYSGYIDRASRLLSEKRYTEGTRSARLAIALAASIKNRVRDINSYIGLSDTYAKLSRAESKAFRFDESREYLLLSVSTWREGAPLINTAYAYYRLAFAEYDYANDVYVIDNNKGREHFIAADEAIKKTLTMSNRDTYRHFRACLLYEHAESIRRHGGKKKRASSMLLEAVDILRELELAESHNTLFECYYLLATLAGLLNEGERYKYFSLAYATYKSYKEDIRSIHILKVLDYAIKNDITFD